MGAHSNNGAIGGVQMFTTINSDNFLFGLQGSGCGHKRSYELMKVLIKRNTKKNPQKNTANLSASTDVGKV